MNKVKYTPPPPPSKKKVNLKEIKKEIPFEKSVIKCKNQKFKYIKRIEHNCDVPDFTANV